jgi:hypothetical protein
VTLTGRSTQPIDRAVLSATILAAIASASKLSFDSVIHWTVATQTLRVLNELLIALMLAEILHTVRISIRSHVLVTEPFLVVGLITSIRRILVISLEIATLGKEAAWTGDNAVIFRNSMIELGLLSLLVLVLVLSITLCGVTLHRCRCEGLMTSLDAPRSSAAT